MENVILVNEKDEIIGEMEKMEAHYKGLLHRAFSVFIFNDKNEMLLQKRASSKYHSGGLWSNTCCSHPRMGETEVAAGERRLEEELGFSVKLTNVFSFIYKAELDNQLTEHELDHVLVGDYNKAPVPNPEEVEDWKYVSISWLEMDLKANPGAYTVWFKVIFPKVKSLLNATIS